MARRQKTFVPVDDDIDAPEDDQEGQEQESQEQQADVLVEAGTESLALTEDDVVLAEREARLMQRFFQQDWRWQRCRKTAHKVITLCHAVWEDPEIKAADLYRAQQKAHHFRELMNILEEAPRQFAEAMRARFEDAKKKGMPLLDAAERAARKVVDIVDADTGEVVDDDAE